MKHGTSSSYLHKKCRCTDCKEAYSKYNKDRRARLKPEDAPHGTRVGRLVYGCSCELCTAADNAYRRKLYLRIKEQYLLRQRLESRNVRLEVLAAYGGVCACCGEDYEPFLAIDHIGGDGASNRKREQGKVLHRRLRREGWPEGYQVLCMNCNWRKGTGAACDCRSATVRTVKDYLEREGYERLR